MNKLTLINLEWNCYNGFCFDILGMDSYRCFNNDSSLFGINVSRQFLYIDILWITLTIFDKNKI